MAVRQFLGILRGVFLAGIVGGMGGHPAVSNDYHCSSTALNLACPLCC